MAGPDRSTHHLELDDGHALRAYAAAAGVACPDQRAGVSSAMSSGSSGEGSAESGSSDDPLGGPDQLSAFFSHAQLHSSRNIYQEDLNPLSALPLPHPASPSPFGFAPPPPVHSPGRSASESTSMINHPRLTQTTQLELLPDTLHARQLTSIQYPAPASQYTTTPSSPHPPREHHQKPSRTPQPMSATQPTPSAPPMTNRSRIESGEQILLSGSGTGIAGRPRRVSDGSATGGGGGALRKDMLLQRMAEALKIERAKSLVFQRELQNAEHEIDELASSLDEMKRSNHKSLYILKKEVSALKKERESLLEALEVAEGVEQQEAERYMALIDPTQAVLLDPNQEDQQGLEQDEHITGPGGQELTDPDDDRYRAALEHSEIARDETVRAQAQKRSAIRARRINDEISKLSPAGQADVDIGSTPHTPRQSTGIEREDRRRERENDRRGERESDRRGVDRDVERRGERDIDRGGRKELEVERDSRRVPVTTHRARRLSKSRPSSKDGGGGGVFWRRSGSRNREGGGDLETTRNLSGGGGGNQVNVSSSECYDSGSLQNRGSASGGGSGVGKIGKLFRKVFPIHGNDQDWNGDVDHNDEEIMGGGGGVNEDHHHNHHHHRFPTTNTNTRGGSDRVGRNPNLIGSGNGGTRMVGGIRSSSRTRA